MSPVLCVITLHLLLSAAVKLSLNSVGSVSATPVFNQIITHQVYKYIPPSSLCSSAKLSSFPLISS